MKEKFLLTLMVVLFCVVSVQAGTETLLHRWSFTTDLSDSVGGATGTLNGAAALSPGYLDCRLGGSMSTPGIKASVEVERSLTIEMWIYEGQGNVAFMTFLDWGHSGDWDNMFRLLNHAGDYRAYMWPTATPFVNTISTFLGASSHHLVTVVDITNDVMTVYDNGAYVTEVALGGLSVDDINHDAAGMGYVLGGRHDGLSTGHAVYSNFKFDEYRIWDGAMNALEVAAAYGLGPDDAAVPNIEIPTVTMLSVSESYAATTAVTLAVDATDTTSYQWYQDGSPVGTDANTLAIASMSASDNGVYYCEATGAGGSVDSDEIHIAVKDLVAHYEFNDDLTDSSGHGNHLQVDIGTAVYANEGDVDGNSLDISGAADRMKLISDANDIPMHDQDYTIIAWSKFDTDMEIQYFASWGDEAFVAGEAVALASGPATPSTDVYAVVNYWGNVLAPYSIYDYYASDVAPWDGYRMYVTTYEGEQGWRRTYIDGGLSYETDAMPVSYAIDQAGANDLKVGWAGTVLSSQGALFDDIKIYNYALTEEEIAQAYFDVTGNTTCVQATGTYDIDVDDNCVIDFVDFAQIAADWLDCTILPATECP